MPGHKRRSVVCACVRLLERSACVYESVRASIPEVSELSPAARKKGVRDEARAETDGGRRKGRG